MAKKRSGGHPTGSRDERTQNMFCGIVLFCSVEHRIEQNTKTKFLTEHRTEQNTKTKFLSEHRTEQNTNFCFPKNIYARLALCADEAEKIFHVILWIPQILRMSRILVQKAKNGRFNEIKLDGPKGGNWTVLKNIKGCSQIQKLDGLKR